MSELHALMTGLVVGESPRWHEGRLWFSNWGAQEPSYPASGVCSQPSACSSAAIRA